MTLYRLDYCANKNSNDDFGNNNAIMQSQKRKVIKARTAAKAAEVGGMIIITALQSTMNMLNSPSCKSNGGEHPMEPFHIPHGTCHIRQKPKYTEKLQKKRRKN